MSPVPEKNVQIKMDVMVNERRESLDVFVVDGDALGAELGQNAVHVRGGP